MVGIASLQVTEPFVHLRFSELAYGIRIEVSVAADYGVGHLISGHCRLKCRTIFYCEIKIRVKVAISAFSLVIIGDVYDEIKLVCPNGV